MKILNLIKAPLSMPICSAIDDNLSYSSLVKPTSSFLSLLVLPDCVDTLCFEVSPVAPSIKLFKSAFAFF